MKTRRIAFWIALLLLAGTVLSAGAEVVGRTADALIHRFTAGNGQEIYFVSTAEETIVDTATDVNFDGQPDLTVVTAQGASNTFFAFYLWNGSEYVPAEPVPGDVANYALVDGRYLVSWRNDGSAGLLCHAEICVWEGSELKTIRTLDAEEETVIEWEGRVMTQTTNLDRLHVVVRELDGAVGAAEVLWEQTYEPFPEDPAVPDEMNAQLWAGLED